MKNKIIIFGMLVVVFTSQACRNKCSEGERGNPYIDLPMAVSPADTAINLGDTITINIEIPFNNINTRNGSRIDISNSTISEFGLDHAMYIKTGPTSHTILGLDEFKIIYEKGGGGRYTTTSTQNRFEKTATGFVFREKVIPLRKGLIDFVVFRAEGEMEKGCVLVDFSPVCINVKKNHQLFANFFNAPLDPGFSSLYPNRFYIWVK
jgi:hypothetical protein